MDYIIWSYVHPDEPLLIQTQYVPVNEQFKSYLNIYI